MRTSCGHGWSIAGFLQMVELWCDLGVPEIASDELKGRVFEINLGDLKNNNDGYSKVKLICEEVQGKNVLTNFYGMSFTRDKVASLIRK